VPWAKKNEHGGPLISETGVELTRPVAFKFALDPTLEQSRQLFMCAGARRFAYNHHIGRVKHNLSVRSAEKDAGTKADLMTPSLSWAAVSFINQFNAWKTGKLDYSPVAEDGTRGLPWRDEVPADVFECASVDAATALKNYRGSVTGARAGPKVGFPRFAAKHKETPRFRLRAKYAADEKPPVRFVGTKALHFPVLGDMRVHGCGRAVAKMMAKGRFHVYSASFSFKAGRWYVSLAGVAAPFHHQRRSADGRHQIPVGADRGVKSLIVAGDAAGNAYKSWEGVKPLGHSQDKLRRASKALSRTKESSAGRAKARAHLAKVHHDIALQRSHVAHQASYDLASSAAVLCIEDLYIAGMMANHCLPKAVADAAMGEAGRRLAYKCNWYGAELHLADRWYASSKTCSGCGHKKERLDLSERTYRCEACGLVIDRDLNAAINLARWPGLQTSPEAEKALATAA
jgi:putative transposase